MIILYSADYSNTTTILASHRLVVIQLQEKVLQLSRLKRHRLRGRLPTPLPGQVHLGGDHTGDLQPRDLCLVQELQDLVHRRVLQDEHLLAHVLRQGQEAALGVVPGVGVQLLVVGIQGL